MKMIIQRLQRWIFGADHSTSRECARERARRGAAYLDEADPGWHARIDLGGLTLESGSACVLGQLHGDFRRGLMRARLLHLGSAPRASVSPVRYGFQCVRGVSDEETDRDFRFLNRAWREEVRRRQPASERERAPDETAQAGDAPVPRSAMRTKRA